MTPCILALSCAGHVLRRFDLSYLTHHAPYFGEIVVLRTDKVAMKKMAIIIYILACFNKWPVHRLHVS